MYAQLKVQNVPQAAAGPVGAFVALKKQIADMEAAAEVLREEVVVALGADGAGPGTTWEFPGLATVSVVSGRVSERLDRSQLAKAGVAAEVLDAATVRTKGKPGIRIKAVGGE